MKSFLCWITHSSPVIQCKDCLRGQVQIKWKSQRSPTQKFIFKQKVQQDIPIMNTSTEEIHSLCIVFETPRILWSVSASHSILHAFFSCAKLSSDTFMINIWHFVTQKGGSRTSASGQQDYYFKCLGNGVDGRCWFPLRLHPSLLVLVHICAISGITVPFYLFMYFDSNCKI